MSELKSGEWISVEKHGKPKDDKGGKYWTIWTKRKTNTDADVKLSTMMDGYFQAPCFTDEGKEGWFGNVGHVSHYIKINKPLPPEPGQC